MNNLIKKNEFEILSQSFNLSNQAVFWLNKDGLLLYANACGLNTLGYTLEEFQQLHLWDVDATVNTKEKYFEKVAHFELNGPDGLPNVIETIHKKKNGKTFPVEVVSKLTKIEGEEVLISYAKDISKRLKRDEDIKFYFSLINSSNDIIFLADYMTGLVEFANETACNIIGYTLAEFKKMKVSDFREPLESIDNTDIPEVFLKIQENNDMTTYGVYTKKDGTKFPVETSLHLNKHQKANFVTAISRDITERLEIEREKEALNHKLQNYNETLESEINKAKEELIEYEHLMKRQSKMAAMGEMLENISHQWRQPLSAISVLSTGMIIQNNDNLLSKNLLNDSLSHINDQVQYLSKTIDDFRNFFKPNKQKNSFQSSRIIKVLLNLSKAKYEHESIEFITNIEEIELFTFENELLQVLLNLLSNAKDELSKKEQKKYIFIEFFKDEKEAVIVIKDNAGGIREDIIDRIFEPYFTTKHSYAGTGIGLYMSEKIIIEHIRGKISAKNIEFEYKEVKYNGAHFELRIPL